MQRSRDRGVVDIDRVRRQAGGATDSAGGVNVTEGDLAAVVGADLDVFGGGDIAEGEVAADGISGGDDHSRTGGTDAAHGQGAAVPGLVDVDAERTAGVHDIANDDFGLARGARGGTHGH